MEGITLQAVPMMPKRSQGTPLPVKQEAQVVLPKAHYEQAIKQPEVSTSEVEQRRFQLMQDIANKYVLGDTRLSMFYKDMGGQYVTRFVNLRDGKVTYIPEPQLMQLSGRGAQPVIQLDA